MLNGIMRFPHVQNEEITRDRHGYDMGFAGDFDGSDINEFAKGPLKMKYMQKLQSKHYTSSLILNIQPKGGIIQ